jgi:hypothetical protein
MSLRVRLGYQVTEDELAKVFQTRETCHQISFEKGHLDR